jgi:hypothetical protein
MFSFARCRCGTGYIGVGVGAGVVAHQIADHGSSGRDAGGDVLGELAKASQGDALGPRLLGIGYPGRVRKPKLNENGKCLGDHANVAMQAADAAGDAIETPHDQRPIVCVIQVLGERRLNH